MQTARKIKAEVVPKRHPQKQLRVVKAKRRLVAPHPSSMFSFFLVFATTLAVILIFNVSQRALIAQGALKNKQLKDVFEKEELKQQQLLLTKTELCTPGRIEKIATEKLGLVNPPEISYLELPNMVRQKETAKPLNSSTPKKDPPWHIMTERVAGQIGMSSLRGLGLR